MSLCYRQEDLLKECYLQLHLKKLLNGSKTWSSKAELLFISPCLVSILQNISCVSQKKNCVKWTQQLVVYSSIASRLSGAENIESRTKSSCKSWKVLKKTAEKDGNGLALLNDSVWDFVILLLSFLLQVSDVAIILDWPWLLHKLISWAKFCP
jgi:hypothetical protein